MLLSHLSFSQAVGYEMRTNGKSYMAFAYKGFELRHRTSLDENRFTYRKNFKIDKRIVFSVPLHYKVEKSEPTLEPRLVYKSEKFNVWIQKEFWIDERMNTAIAVDIPYKNYQWRIGWDDSNTFRWRLMYKF